MSPLKSVLPAFLLFVVMTVLAGCAKQITVSRYPAFYDPNIKTIAVVPFENHSNRKYIGHMIADHLTAALTANQTYKVLGPVQLRRTLKDLKLPRIRQENYKQIAAELGKAGNLQAFIGGQVLGSTTIGSDTPAENTYASSAAVPAVDFADWRNDGLGSNVHYADFYTYSSGYRPGVHKADFDEDEGGDDDEEDFGDFYDYDYYPGWYYPYYFDWYYPYYDEYITQADISVSASLVSVPEGSILYSVDTEATSSVSGFSPPPSSQAVHEALYKLTKRLVSDFAVVPVQIKIYPNRDFKLADGMQNGQWHYTNTFGKTEKSMFVVLCLPSSAAHNIFKLTITPANSPSSVLVEQSVEWGGLYCRGIEFSPAAIARKNGPGNYSAHFYSHGRLVMSKNFKIK